MFSWLRTNKGKGVLAAMAGLALVLGVAILLSPREDASRASPVAGTSEAPRGAPPASQVAPVFSEPPPVSAALETIDRPRIERAREQYLEFAQYPPTSRAYHEGLREMIDWNRPMPLEVRLTEEGVEPAVYATLVLDRMFAGPDEEINATVSLRGAGAAPVSFGLQGFVEAEDKALADESGEGPLERLERIGFDPTDDPQVWEARFTPSRIPGLAERPLGARFVAEIDLGGGEVRSLDTDFRYSADEVVSIYGILEERIVDGSLEITLDAEVHRAGPVKVRGVLFDASGEEPLVTYSEYHPTTATGRQPLVMTFFGKAIVDGKRPGPYQVGAIHGILRDAASNPPEIFWGYGGRLTTGAYSVDEFSAAEWSHPSKTAKLEMYESLLSASQN